MNHKPVVYTWMGLLAGSTATALILTLNPLSQVSQAYPQPSPTVPGMRGGMMGQPEQHFIVMMTPHHQGAIAMADLALKRSQRPEIRTLAESIKTSQSREIEQMRTLYQQWYNADVPQWTPGMGMQRHGRGRQPIAQANGPLGMGCMGGMMMGNTAALENATDFDRAFIEEMIPHHQMGVRMAQMVLVHSSRPEIRELAQAMIDVQTAEINQMQQWYQEWY